MAETVTEQDVVEAYRLDSADVLKQFESRVDGLDASTAARRLDTYGSNGLQALKKDSLFIRFLRQFKDLMIVLLIVSAVLAVYLGDKRTAIILTIIVIVNATIGFAQEYKAEKVMESLEKLVVPLARVKRGGKLQEIASAELVPGDVIYIQEGDSVPADARVLDETELSTNDFALTGESNPSRKFTHKIATRVELPNRHNLVFMGTTVATGDATCIVIATGMRTELGRIASLSQDTRADPSPLQKEMSHLAFTITKGTLILTAILTTISLAGHQTVNYAFGFAIGIAAAMIPQGLPAEVNTALAQAAGKLAKARALVKKLSAVETLGATSVILTDKTGTLTKNQMTVEQLLVGNEVFYVTGGGYQSEGEILDAHKKPLSTPDIKAMEIFFACGVLASNAGVHEPDEEHPNWYVLGDPTEGALITLGRKAGIDQQMINKLYVELREFPFDSGRKRMTSIRAYGDETRAFVKGAPESILDKCTRIMENGKIRKLTVHDLEGIHARNDLLASGAMRNLAYATRVLDTKDTKKLEMDNVEKDLIFLGMVSMIDPPREEIPEAMRAAMNAHIPVSIVTGDNALTAKAIAIKAGLAKKPSDLTLVSGEELRSMSDADVVALITRGQTIFSRVAPEDKLRIVELGKNSGKVVAVTGDGINDAPALKRADIGVAMGKTGTDVAKQSAEIILLDDSFHTLVSAIQQGRVIFHNIKKATLSCLTSNAGELITVLVSLAMLPLLGIPPAITPVMILAIDLMAELFPIAALGWDPPEGTVMNEKPRNPKDHILNRGSIIDLVWSGLLIGLLAYTNFLFFYTRNGIDPTAASSQGTLYAKAITLTYVTICMCQFGNIFLRRISPGHKLFTSYLWSNTKLLGAFALSLVGIMAICYLPIVQKYMGSASLSAGDWLYALSAAAVYMFIRQSISRLRTRPLPNISYK